MKLSRFVLLATVCGLYLLFVFLQQRLPTEKLYMVLGGAPLAVALVLLIIYPVTWCGVHFLRTLTWTALLGLGLPALYFAILLPWAERLTPPLLNVVLGIVSLSSRGFLLCQDLLPLVLVLGMLTLLLLILTPTRLFPELPRSGLLLCALSGLHRVWATQKNLYFDWHNELPLTTAALLTALLLYLFTQATTPWEDLSLLLLRKAGSRRASQARFEKLVIRILTQVALADGRVSQAEAKVILNFFQDQLGYEEARLDRVSKRIQRASNSSENLDPLLINFRKRFPATTRLALLEQVYAMAATKKSGASAELELARHIADMLEISDYNQRRIRDRYFAPEAEWDDIFGADMEQEAGADFQEESAAPESRTRQEKAKAEAQALAVLGLKPGASMELIKKVYHQMVMEYHPDKVAHLGEALKRVADEKMKELNAAYALLKQREKR